MKSAIIVMGAIGGVIVGGLLGRLSFSGHGDVALLAATLIGATLGVGAGGWITARIVDRQN
jgi:hypothetical protein